MVSPKDIPRRATELLPISHNLTDCFAQLPIDICEVIAVHLTTPDFFNIRTVSRAMGPVFESSRFWRARFEDVNNERGFIDLLVQDFLREGRPVDWRLLYHRTAVIKCSRIFDSTIRVWEFIRWLRDATVAKPQDGLSHFSGRALQHYHNTRFINTHIERAYLDSSLVMIAISAVKRLEEHAVYITGMEFIYDGCRPSTSIGYTTAGAIDISEEDIEPESESQTASPDQTRVEEHIDPYLNVVYKDPGAKVTLDARSLRGFHVDLGPDGVYAISLIRNDRCSSYVGINHGCSCYSACDEQTHHLQLLEVREVIATLGVSHFFVINGVLYVANAGTVSQDPRPGNKGRRT